MPAAVTGQRRRLRSWPQPAALVVAAGTSAWLAWHAGGYFAVDYVAAGAVALTALGVMLVAVVPRWRVSTHALVGVAALAAYTAWTGLSATWAPSAAGALHAMQRDLLYLGVFGLGLVAAGSGRHARAIAWGALAALVTVVLAGLLSRLAPDLVHPGPEVPSLAQGRLGWPLTYWNAYGALAAMATVLACGLAADPRTRVWLRASCAGIAVACFVAMYLSLSRGAWLALIAGGVVLAVMAVHRGSLALTALLVGLAAALAVGRLQGYDELVGASAARPHPGAGHAYLVQLAVVVGFVIATQGSIAAGRASPAVMKALAGMARPASLAVLAAVALVALGGYALAAREIEGRTTTALHDGTAFVRRQWDAFLQPTTLVARGTARLTSARGTRADLYRVALDGFAAHPVRGDGAGGFAFRWMQQRRVDEDVRNAHSLELETLGELGAVGGLLLLGFLATIALAAVRSRLRPGGVGRGQAAAIAGAVTVWAVHAGVDWDWQMPAVTAPALLLAAALYPRGRVRRRRRFGAPAHTEGRLRDWYRERARLDAAAGGSP